MKHNISLLAIFCFSTISAFSQSPDWAWAKSNGGLSLDKGNAVATDAAGNIYVTGGFHSDSISFGSATLMNVPGGAAAQFFVAKYDASGNALWARSAGGLLPDEGNGIATDNSGNVYVTGYFQSDTIIFGSDTLINAMTDYTSDLFIVKYDAAGNELWAKRTGGNSYDYGHGIGTDSNGNVYVSGRFMSDSVSFDAVTLVNHSMISGVTGLDYFITKYDPSGNVVWSQRAGGKGGESGTNLTVDASDNICVTGTFGSDSVRFGAFTLANTHDSTLNYGNLFVVKYSPSGTVLWAKGDGGAFSEEANGIKTDAAGNVFVSGRFYSKNFMIGASSLVNADTTGTYYDIFVAKYSPAGNQLWAKAAGGTDFDEAMSVTTDSYGNVYIAGYYYSLSCSFGTATLTNSGSAFTPNIFLAKYDASGNLVYAYTPGGSSVDEAHGLTTDAWDNIYLTGLYRSTNTIFGSTSLTQAGYGDIVLAKLLPPDVGMDELAEANGMKIYPNPAGSSFTVEIPENALEISVCNSLGQLARTETTDGRTAVVYELKENGIYFVKVKTAKGMITKKVVICR